MSWRRPDGGIVVELHADLTDQPRFLLPGLAADGARREVAPAPGLSVRAFAAEPLFAHLCVHGAISGWRRLKRLADLAWLTRGCDADALARLHAAAEALGAGRTATQAVALLAELFGAPLPDAVAAALARDRAVRALVAGGRRLLTGRGASGTLPLHAMTPLLSPARGYRRSVLRRYLRADPEGPRGVPFPLTRAVRRLAGAETV